MTRRETYIEAPDAPGYVLLEQVIAQTGWPRKTLDERLRAEGISTFSNPRDRRKAMIKIADLDRLTEPREATRRTPRAAHKVG